MIRKESLIAAGVVAGASVLLVAGIASAQTPTGTTLAEKIAQEFNVDRAEVQKVIDSERQKKYQERLNQAVKDGKLTEEQKANLLAKHKELQAQMENKHETMRVERETMGSKTEAERAQLKDRKLTEMDAQHAEIEQWEKDNNIPSGYLMGGDKGFRSGGHGGWGGVNR